MQIEVRTIQPELAAAMLENNPQNRNLRKFHIWQIAEDMRSGAWQLNGDAIRLNCDGSLIDGQHRLAACVLAGVPFETLVISGLPNDVRATIDGGAKRSHGDRLAMSGVKHSRTVASAARVALRIAENTAADRHSVQTVQRVLDRHPTFADSAMAANSVKFGGLGSIVTALHYIGHFTGHGPRADDFVGVFISGIPTYPGDAAHTLRERIIKNGKKAPFPDMVPPTVQAWRNFLARRPISVIKSAGDIRVPGWTPDVL